MHECTGVSMHFAFILSKIKCFQILYICQYCALPLTVLSSFLDVCTIPVCFVFWVFFVTPIFLLQRSHSL